MSVDFPTLEASVTFCSVTEVEFGLLSCCFRTCVKRELILRTSCRSLILSEGKLRFRNWRRGRLRPWASGEVELEPGVPTAWEVVDCDAGTEVEADEEDE